MDIMKECIEKIAEMAALVARGYKIDRYSFIGQIGDKDYFIYRVIMREPITKDTREIVLPFPAKGAFPRPATKEFMRKINKIRREARKIAQKKLDESEYRLN
ncbi:MAG: hypothetical protein RMI91_15280 [Gemmatales bacterium]|nr:hypothetical protein [Gemmatales bacterium]